MMFGLLSLRFAGGKRKKTLSHSGHVGKPPRRPLNTSESELENSLSPSRSHRFANVKWNWGLCGYHLGDRDYVTLITESYNKVSVTVDHFNGISTVLIKATSPEG